MNSTTTTPPAAPAVILKSKYGKSLLLELSGTNININYRQNHKPSKNNINTTIGADLTKVLEFIHQDPLAGRYKDNVTGDNAYHILLNGDFSKEFLVTVLKALIEKSPKGLEDKNILGMLPIHIAMYQRNIMEDIVFLLLKACPKSVKIAATDMLLTPLFYAVMRDNPSYTLVKKICDLYPDSVKQKNKTNSLPIHFACKRIKPHLLILQLFIDLYPDSLLMINSYSWIPLHCLISHSDDLKAVKLLISSCPASVSVTDRQGRTCLHLAVLLVGKDHETAILQAVSAVDDGDGVENDHDDGNIGESIMNGTTTTTTTTITTTTARGVNKMAESMNNLSIRNSNSNNSVAVITSNQKQTKATAIISSSNRKSNQSSSSSQQQQQQNDNGDDDSNSEDDSDDDEDDNNSKSKHTSNHTTTTTTNHNNDDNIMNDTNEVGSLSRQFIRYLIQQYPQALVLTNNFQATPLDTVIEKVHKKHAANSNNNNKTKRNVYIWGLHDDPITARILLLAQQKYFFLKVIPRGLKLQNLKMLYDLNWTNRKYALWVSYGGNSRAFITTITSSNSSSSNNATKSSNHHHKNNMNGKQKSSQLSKTKNQPTFVSNNISSPGVGSSSSDSVNSTNNVLLKLRLTGHEDCIKLSIAFI